MKFTITAVLVGLLTSFVVYAVQPRARLTFPDYEKINNFDEIFFRGRLPFPIGVRGGTGLLPRATRSNSATGPLPVCPALLRVGTHGTENRAQPSPLNATKRAPTEADAQQLSGSLTEVTPKKYKSDNCRSKPDQAQNAFCWAQVNNAHKRLAFVRLFFPPQTRLFTISLGHRICGSDGRRNNCACKNESDYRSEKLHGPWVLNLL